jgi:hypothetical protein
MFRTGSRQFVGQNPPRGATLDFFLPKKADKLSLKVLDLRGKLVRELDMAKEKEAGLHRVGWDLVSGPAPKGPKKGKSAEKPFTPYGQPVKPSAYVIVLDADGATSTQILTVEPDPRTRTPGAAVNEAEELRRLLKQQP